MDIFKIWGIAIFSLFHFYFAGLWAYYFYRWFKNMSIKSLWPTSLVSYIVIVLIPNIIGIFYLYRSWASSPLFKNLLPPQSNNFYWEVFDIFKYYLLSVAIAVVLYFLLRFLTVRVLKNNYIDLEEVKYLTLGVALVGYNNIIVFLLATFGLMVLSSIFMNLFKFGRGKRVILMPYIFIGFIVVSLLVYKVSPLIWPESLR